VPAQLQHVVHRHSRRFVPPILNPIRKILRRAAKWGSARFALFDRCLPALSQRKALPPIIAPENDPVTAG
jgi:hypothetical protein